jgi:hypothetical protein
MQGEAGTRRDELERVVIAAISALWSAADLLNTEALLAHLGAQAIDTPARSLYLLLESLQQRGLIRLSRGNPHRAAAEAHGARTITWVNPAILGQHHAHNEGG